MKKALVCSLAAMMLLCSFSLKNLFGSKSTTTTTTAAEPQTTAVVATSTDGAAAGKALRALYTNYKAAGKYDASNVSNILNTISLINSCKELKTNAKDKTYWSDFAKGLVLGSENLVTDQISGAVTSKLNEIASSIDTEKLESTAQKASAVKTVASDVTTLLQMFK
ncbi:MAG: hypothetical protein MJZ65_03175 [Paludibacteraceae bacterium]|nr:hypothetical protein [Paludibacteraceae bacterium]